MNHYNFTPIDEILAELNVDFNINDAGLLSQVPRHAARAMHLMELDGYFQLTFCKKTTYEGRVELPCTNKYLVQIFKHDGDNVYKINFDKGLTSHNTYLSIPHAPDKVRLDKNFVITEDTIPTTFGFVYYSMPLDDNGMPLILDNEFVKEALPYFIIYKLSLGGYKHPVIDLETANNVWETKSHRARNNVNYPSIEDAIKMTQMMTNPYYDRILSYLHQGGNDGVPSMLSKTLLNV